MPRFGPGSCGRERRMANVSNAPTWSSPASDDEAPTPAECARGTSNQLGNQPLSVSWHDVAIDSAGNMFTNQTWGRDVFLLGNHSGGTKEEWENSQALLNT